MLHRCRDSLALEAADPFRGELSCQEGILAEILEVATVERCARDVHPRAELDMDSSGAGFTAQRLAVKKGELRIPCGRKGYSARKRAGRTVSTHPLGAVGHDELRDAESGNGDRRHAVVAVTGKEADLFLFREFTKQMLHPSFDRGGLIPCRIVTCCRRPGSLDGGVQRDCGKQCCKDSGKEPHDSVTGAEASKAAT